MKNRLLFHPKVTFSAMLVGLGSFCTLVVGIATPLHDVPVIGKYATQIVATAACVGPAALFIATYGRSPAKSVDQNTPATP